MANVKKRKFKVRWIIELALLALFIVGWIVSWHMDVEKKDLDLVEGVSYGYYTHYRLRHDPFEALSQVLHELATPPSVRRDCDAKEQVGCRTARQA